MDEMTEVLDAVGDPEEAARRLVDVANEHGGADNITVVVVDVQIGEDTSGVASTVVPLERRAGTLVAVGLSTNGTANGNGGRAGAVVDPAEPAAGDGEDEPGEPPDGPAGAGAAVGHAGDAGPPSATGAHSTAVLDAAAVLAAGADPSPTSSSDMLAPGARLGFGDRGSLLAEQGPSSDEFFPRSSDAVPVARSSTRVPPVPRPSDHVPAKESRRARRRRLGIPRRITLRVIAFILLVLAVPVAAYYVIRWYAYDNWTVTLRNNQVVVLQGQPGGVLWFHPRVVDRPGITTTQVPFVALGALRAGVQEPSLAAAQKYYKNLYAEAHPPPTTTTTGATTTPTSAPPGAVVTPTTTTTVPATAVPGATP
jgi:hypothetical protein